MAEMNIASNRKKSMTSFIVFAAWTAITLVMLVWGKLMAPGDEMGYSFLSFYLIYPVAALASGIIMSSQNNIVGYFITLLYAGGGVLLPALVFPGSGFDLVSLFSGAFPAFIGMLLGAVVFAVRKRKRSR